MHYQLSNTLSYGSPWYEKDQLNPAQGIPIARPVGRIFGWPLGCNVDWPLGCMFSCPVGRIVGCPSNHLVRWSFGCIVSYPAGCVVGWSLRWIAGCPVGCIVGCPVGCVVGWPVRNTFDWHLSLVVGCTVATMFESESNVKDTWCRTVVRNNEINFKIARFGCLIEFLSCISSAVTMLLKIVQLLIESASRIYGAMMD